VIMPNKHLPPRESLLGVAGRMLRHLGRPRTTSTLWEKARDVERIASFDRFILALDLLYLLGVIEFDEGRVRRVARR
jgi:hypothetical protein